MTRRRFLRLSSLGLAALALSDPGLVPGSLRAWASTVGQSPVNLTIREVDVEMIDLTRVPMWAFDYEGHGPRIPGPAIFSVEGRMMEFRITNATGREHAFAVPGVFEGSVIHPGRTSVLSFKAPSAGTYMYLDPLNAPVNRVMGLHGALAVLPRTGNTPYGNPTSRVQNLFNDLGGTDRFPGSPWSADRTWIWVLNTIDPAKNKWATAQQEGKPVDATEFMKNYLPRYFTINGKTGFFAAHDPEIMPAGTVGQPALIRAANAGVATHSPHIHGNHAFLIAENGGVRENAIYVDTWSMPPGSTKDVLLPFTRPPDIPPGAWPPSEESLPFHYPIHCHTQMSQTAAGGNYPQGLSVHWMLLPDEAGHAH